METRGDRRRRTRTGVLILGPRVRAQSPARSPNFATMPAPAARVAPFWGHFGNNPAVDANITSKTLQPQRAQR